MRDGEVSVRANVNNDIGTVLVLPYQVSNNECSSKTKDQFQNEEFSFFYLMPKESSTLEKMRNELTGEKLINALKGADDSTFDV